MAIYAPGEKSLQEATGMRRGWVYPVAKSTCANFTVSAHVTYAAIRSSSDDCAIRYVLPVFVDDVMFSHTGANGPESKTALYFVELAVWRHRRRSVQSRLSCWIWHYVQLFVNSQTEGGFYAFTFAVLTTVIHCMACRSGSLTVGPERCRTSDQWSSAVRSHHWSVSLAPCPATRVVESHVRGALALGLFVV